MRPQPIDLCHRLSIFLLLWQKVLQLTLKREPFAVMVTGEKKKEFRSPGAWILSRLVDSKTGERKQYDRVSFSNGYGAHRPRFTVSYKGYTLEPNGVHEYYSNGLEVDTRGEATYVIFLGDDIVEEVPL